MVDDAQLEPADTQQRRPGGARARAALGGARAAAAASCIYGQRRARAGERADGVGSERSTIYGDQYGVRYSGWRGLVLDAGKLQPVIGTFAPRHFSNRNPLIGAPDAYSLEYPLGAVLSGDFKAVDFRAGAVTLPATHAGYVPPATARLRPAVGAGFTPVVGVRLGGSWTEGPYLNDDLTPAELRDAPWTHYHQRVVALDARAAHGYLETFAEAARATYDVPGHSVAILGYTYYGEAKYTFAPRFYLAVRGERNAYPFIRASATNWTARRVDFVNGELGAGYRLTPSTLLKLSLRGDRWWVAEPRRVSRTGRSRDRLSDIPIVGPEAVALSAALRSLALFGPRARAPRRRCGKECDTD